MGLLKWDIKSDNFDYFFERLINKKLTEPKKELLPKSLLYKLYNKGGNVDATTTSKLTLIEKLYVIWKALKGNIYIVVEDEEDGMTIEQFSTFKKIHKKRDYSIGEAEGVIALETFVLAKKELADSFSTMNEICHSPAYNYLMKTKNSKLSKVSEFKSQMTYIIHFFANFEARKKRVVMQAGLNMPELLVLSYAYGRNEFVGATLYKEYYKYCFQSSAKRIKQAFGSLQNKGFLQKFGENSGAKMKITALGTSKMTELVHKNFINF